MGQTLSFAVETYDGDRFRLLGEFRRLDVACRAAALSVNGRVTLAVVKDRDGRLVYAANPSKEWCGEPGHDYTDHLISREGVGPMT